MCTESWAHLMTQESALLDITALQRLMTINSTYAALVTIALLEVQPRLLAMQDTIAVITVSQLLQANVGLGICVLLRHRFQTLMMKVSLEGNAQWVSTA